jgi:hypothetical protein
MSNEHNPSDILGKKLFFLYPSATIQNQIIAELVQQEFEVYAVKDHVKLRAILKKYPDSVVYLNLNDQLPEPECEAWIKGVLADPGTSKTVIGVITTAYDEALERKYKALKVKGGYIFMKTSIIIQAIKEILEALKAVDAKGRRKYIRATSEDDPSATINLPVNSNFIHGHIKDISAVGLSCTFPEDPGLQKNSLFQNIQIKLQSMILKAEGIVFGSRMDGSNKVYVILFTQRVDPEVHIKIRLYIQQNLQAKMDKELN